MASEANQMYSAEVFLQSEMLFFLKVLKGEEEENSGWVLKEGP